MIHTIPSDGLTLAVEEFGKGPPLVFAHGLTGNRHVTRAQLTPLAGRYRIIIYDQRGHNDSTPVTEPALYAPARMAADMTAVLDALSIEKAIVGGESMGAATALLFALRHPQRVDKLLLTAPAFGDTLNPAADDIRQMGESIAQLGLERFLQQAAIRQRDELEWPEVVIERVAQMRGSHDAASLALACQTVIQWQILPNLEALSTLTYPVCILAWPDDARQLRCLWRHGAGRPPAAPDRPVAAFADGMTMMAAPGDFARLRFINIPDFCLYWIMAVRKYVQYSGDTALADELSTAVHRAIGWFQKYVNEDDLLTDVPHWIFVDWAELDKKGQVTTLNAQFVAALHTAVYLAQLTGQTTAADVWRQLAAAASKAINTHLWDEERGVYVDARGSRRVSQQSNAAVIAFDVAPPERWPRILDAILDEDRVQLTRVGEREAAYAGFDEEQHVVMAQPFFSHHLHRALSKVGRTDALLANIRRHWGALVEAGDDTFRETWQIDGLTSLCHAFSATPTFDLSTEVLGITPLQQGFTHFQVTPNVGDLAWAHGDYPTPQGNIEVD